MGKPWTARRPGRRGESEFARSILTAVPEAVIVLDASGDVLEMNPAAERMLGIRHAEADEHIVPVPVPGGHDQPDGRHTVQATRADGSRFTADVTSRGVELVDGTRLRVLYVRDPGERPGGSRAALDLAAIVGSSADAIVSVALDGTIESWSPGAERLFGHTSAEVAGRDARVIMPPGRAGELASALDRARAGERVENLETVGEHRDGSPVHLSVTVTPVVDPDGTVVALSAIARDLGERRRAEERVAYLAYHDELTGLPNRRMFHEHLELALARAARHNRAVAVLCTDLDNFKLVNDSYGHRAGDELLRQTASRLRAATRAEDLVARQGGDEFLILVTDLPLDDEDGGAGPAAIVDAIVSHVREELQAPSVIDGSDVYTGGSIGVSVYPHDASGGDELLRRADDNLFAAKAAARGGPAHPFSRDAALQRISLTARLHHALALGEFVLHYQPIVRLDEPEVVGVEALIRWNHPERGLLRPSAFIPLAERAGLIGAISDWVIERTCRDSELWQNGEVALDSSVNLPVSFLQEPAVARLLATVQACGLDPARLMVEITETAAMTDPARTLPLLESMHGQGVKVAIDDFGTGHSSLHRLTQMPVSTLKIDRAFVRDIPGSEDANAIAVTIIQLAQNIGATAIAEGIETDAQHEFLRRHGCALGQGFLFSHAVPPDAVPRLVHQLASPH